jgi:hypothetical protein
MAIAHRELPVYGVQFHPESVLTTDGYQLLANFLKLSGINYELPVPPPLITRPLQGQSETRPANWAASRPHHYQ